MVQGGTDRADESERISRDVLDRLLEGCQVIGPDWRYLYVNEATVAQSRTTRDALIGRTMMQCYPGIETTPMFALLQRAMAERTTEHMENEFLFPNGSRMVFELRFIPVPQGVCILSLDITERRHQLAAIVNDCDDAVIGRTLDGHITSWNKSAERILGHSAASILGQRIDVLFPPWLVTTELANTTERVARGERVAHYETVRARRDGVLLEVSVTLSPVSDAAGKIIGISEIVRDITDRKRAERELVEAKDAVEAANRELEAFSYSVAHDLRAPLRSIDGFSQALLEDCADSLNADGLKYLSFIRGSAQLMAQLIDDILTLSRVSRAELIQERVSLSSLARSSVERLRHAEPARDVDVVIADGLEGRGDHRLLAVVIDNLLGNAWKFTSKCAHARIEVGAHVNDGKQVFFVKDNGAGFDMQYVDKLFGVFQRLHTSHEFEGTGVGLATVQRVIHRHGGRVWAEGEVGVGATISFSLGMREDVNG